MTGGWGRKRPGNQGRPKTDRGGGIAWTPGTGTRVSRSRGGRVEGRNRATSKEMGSQQSGKASLKVVHEKRTPSGRRDKTEPYKDESA